VGEASNAMEQRGTIGRPSVWLRRRLTLSAAHGGRTTGRAVWRGQSFLIVIQIGVIQDRRLQFNHLQDRSALGALHAPAKSDAFGKLDPRLALRAFSRVLQLFILINLI